MFLSLYIFYINMVFGGIVRGPESGSLTRLAAPLPAPAHNADDKTPSDEGEYFSPAIMLQMPGPFPERGIQKSQGRLFFHPEFLGLQTESGSLFPGFRRIPVRQLFDIIHLQGVPVESDFDFLGESMGRPLKIVHRAEKNLAGPDCPDRTDMFLSRHALDFT
jgi:hypothetical protein